LKYLNSQKRLNVRHSKWAEFVQDYIFVLKHKTRVENTVADVLSRRVMIFVAMSAEMTEFERLGEKYESCPDFEKYIPCNGMGLLERWTGFCYMMNIYLDSVGYVFSIRPSGILSLGNCMLEVWLDTSVRT